MKPLQLLIAPILLLAACGTPGYVSSNGSADYRATDTIITQSLFNDKASTITEENIQKVLDGNYKLPQQLRVAIVRMEPSAQAKSQYLAGKLSIQ